jgi:hypothetical protein
MLVGDLRRNFCEGTTFHHSRAILPLGGDGGQCLPLFDEVGAGWGRF